MRMSGNLLAATCGAAPLAFALEADVTPPSRRPYTMGR